MDEEEVLVLRSRVEFLADKLKLAESAYVVLGNELRKKNTRVDIQAVEWAKKSMDYLEAKYLLDSHEVETLYLAEKKERERLELELQAATAERDTFKSQFYETTGLYENLLVVVDEMTRERTDMAWRIKELTEKLENTEFRLESIRTTDILFEDAKLADSD